MPEMPELPIQTTITNEQTAALPALSFEGDIVVVDRENQIEAACADLASYPIIGFDTETRPSFKAGVSYKVSLLQLSTPTCCYLFRLNKIPFSKEIAKLLESERIVKVGADVAGDIRSLNQIRNIKDRGFYDLQSVIWEWGIGEKSLRKMSALTLGYRISKAQRLSNWEASSLTQQQRVYAATDAWVCIEIYNKLQALTKLLPDQIALLRADQERRAAEAKAKKDAKLAARTTKEGGTTKRIRYRRSKSSKPRSAEGKSTEKINKES